MIKAKDLRIGNYFKQKGGKKCYKLKQIFFQDVNTYFFTLAYSKNHAWDGGFIWNFDAEYVPLTEEWLIKFGFTEWFKSQFSKFFVLENIKIMDRGKLGFYFYYGEKENDYVIIQYVHELQNLWYAITKTELK